jgi:hypothetical protein
MTYTPKLYPLSALAIINGVKRLAATNLADYYCKALGYLGGALKLTPNTDTILAESARSACEYVKERALRHLGTKINEALSLKPGEL